MNRDTLILLCHSTKEAVHAANTLPVQSLHRFFIFLDELPPIEEFANLIAPDDEILRLGHTADWCEDPVSAGVRAGLLYGTGWNLIFCHANALPETDELHRLQAILLTDTYARSRHLWAVSREHCVLNGWHDAFIGPIGDDAALERPIDGRMIAQALAGVRVQANVVIAALEEVVATNSVGYSASLFRDDKQDILTFATRFRQRHPSGQFPYSTWLTCDLGEDDLTWDDLCHITPKMPEHGALILLTHRPRHWLPHCRPYRHFETEEGFSVLVIAAHSLTGASAQSARL